MLLMRLTSFWNNLTSFPVIDWVAKIKDKGKVHMMCDFLLSAPIVKNITESDLARKNPWHKSFNEKASSLKNGRRKQLL